MWIRVWKFWGGRGSLTRLDSRLLGRCLRRRVPLNRQIQVSASEQLRCVGWERGREIGGCLKQPIQTIGSRAISSATGRLSETAKLKRSGWGCQGQLLTDFIVVVWRISLYAESGQLFAFTRQNVAERKQSKLAANSAGFAAAPTPCRQIHETAIPQTIAGGGTLSGNEGTAAPTKKKL